MRHRHSLATRALAYALTVLITWAQLAPLASAVPTDLGDAPPSTRGRAKPNMIMAVDDSASMDSEYSPVRGFSTNDGAAWWNVNVDSFVGCGAADEAVAPAAGGCNAALTDPAQMLSLETGVAAAKINFNIAGGASATWKKYVYLFPNGHCGGNCATRVNPDADNDHFAIPPTREFAFFRSPVFNAQYYNPAVRYDPWRPYNDGTTTTSPPEYRNGGTSTLNPVPPSANWNAVRSHPMYNSGSTLNLETTVAQPGDANADNWEFRMYPGMILPAGSRYKICNNAGNNGGCGGWNDNTADRCIRGNGSQGCGNASWIIPGYVRTANGATTDTQNLGIGGNNHLEVQIAYLPATVWVQSKNAGALAANESWGPILPGQTTATRLIRIDITSATTSYAKAGTRSDCVGATCSYAEELTNFSNWFAYYRKRHMYLNAATGIAFDQVTGIRVGQFVFNNRNDVTMYDFDNTNDNANARRLLYDLYRIKGTGGTPTRESLEHAGRQFQRTGTSAPIQAACQYNAAFVITDGFANASGPTSYGNADSNASNRFTVPYDINNPDLNYNDPPPAPPGNISRPSPLGGPALPAVTVTPAPPYPDGFSNTMADIAMYFYSTNLRSDLTTRQVVVNPGDTGREADRNDMLHMNTFALGLGVQGVVFGRNDSATVIAQNQDPYTNPPDWNAIGDPRQFDRNPRAVDDLWHATINGRGKMLSASAPEEARSGVVDVINNVGARGGAGAAVAVANPNLFPGDNFSYASSYNSGAWSGDLNKYAVDLSTGQPSTTGLWTPSPQKQLATRVPTTRLIATTNPSGGGGGVPVGTPFQWNNLNATQQTLLGSDSQVLDFLRGDRSREVDKFRSRGPRPQRDAGGNFVLDGTGRYVYVNNITPDNVAVLGDIINAEPVVVRNPTRSYFDAGYGEFRTTQSGRAGVVYQGGNDGMLHAFSVEDGTELWAYVPSWTFPTLRNLSDRTGFRHLYYVDGTPAVGDVDFGRVGGSIGTPDWRTILVGGLRKGGFGYYALDITNPSAGSETDVANKVLWEFPNDSNPTLMSTVERRNVGYSFGKPVIVKTRAHGWVALVTSGYNNGNTGVGSSGGDGRGYLYVLNARTGALLKVMETQAGTADTPSGLGPISAFISRPAIDATAEAIYGGDLLGNVWRFDVSSANPDLWTVTRLAALRSTSGGPASTGIQPITTEPELGTINRKRVVFVGGGQYLGDSDAMQTAGTIPPENAYTRRTMSFYALRDDLSTPVFPTPVISDVRSLQQQTVTVSGDLLNITNTAVNFNTQAGWFFDFPRTGERAVTNPILSGGVVVFTTNIPDRFDLCNPGGSSWAYFVDYQTGGLIPGAISAGQKIGNVLSSRVVLVRLPNGNIVGLVRGSDAQTRQIDPPNTTTSTVGRRLSWREVPDESPPP